MGWDIGHLAQNTPKIPKIPLKADVGGVNKFVPGTICFTPIGQFIGILGPSEPNDQHPIPFQPKI